VQILPWRAVEVVSTPVGVLGTERIATVRCIGPTHPAGERRGFVLKKKVTPYPLFLSTWSERASDRCRFDALCL
jgi:hypothetical protein